MKKSALFLSIWFLLALTAQADAAPVVGLIGLIGQLGVIGQLIIGVALKVGLTLYERAKQKKTQTQPSGVKGSLRTGGDNPLSMIVGTYATAGSLEYVGSWGQDGKTPNAYLTQVMSLADLPASAMSNIVWIAGARCTIDWNAAPTEMGYPVLEYRRSGTDYLWIKFHDGTATVADPFLLARFNGGDRPWLADMVGRGVAYAIVTSRYNREVFTNVPSVKFVVQGLKLYDIRKDSTAGGAGAHRWGAYATYEFSDNPKVIQYNVLRGLTYNGEWFYGGQNMQAFQLPASNWMAAMNECDRLVPTAAGGMEKQFRAGAEIETSTQPIDVVRELDKTCNGRTAELGGIYKTICGAPGLPVYNFTDADIVITSDQDLDPYPGFENTINGANTTYPEPAEGWTMKDAPPRYNADLEDQDAGFRALADLQYPYAPYALQVQRLVDAALKEARRFRQHNATLPPEAWLLEPFDVVSWTSERNGYETKRFLLGQMEDLPNVNQAVAIQEIDPEDYDWSADFELPTSTGPTGPIQIPPQPMYGWVVEPGVIKDANGKPFRPTIKISAAPDQDDVKNVWVQVRLAATEEVQFDTDSTPYGAPFSWLLQGNFARATDYEARGKFVPYSARETNWSEWLPVRTPDVSSDDLVADLAHIGEDVRAIFRDLYDAMGRNETLLERLQQSFQITSGVSQTLSRKVAVQGASFSEDIVVLNSSVANIVAQTEELIAAFGENLANGLVSFQAVAAPDGVTVRYAILLKGSIGASWEESGLFMEIYTVDGVLKSRIAFDADQFVVITSDDTSASPFVIENGELTLNSARIGSIRGGDWTSDNGKMKLDGIQGSIEIFS